MRAICLTIVALSLAACSDPGTPARTDQKLRHTYFMECLNVLPKPERIKYWGDAVRECDYAARQQATQ